ncbi:hypothetical protein [Alteromonas sp. a30]|uniref:hypothetical protein n=1 Tax=Alteromonas sp. a30 TaxID=2730917 RepID=UPI0022801A5A|nr:hypothetical protein [Alteromonas sp. a30]MCY7297140.1 hypothetical protein [Alteromonas sp. a30]
MESKFNDMLIKLKPPSDLFELAKKNFSIHWDKRRNNHQSNHASNVETLKGIESKIEKLVARVIDTESPTLISTYEKSIQELERKKPK